MKEKYKQQLSTAAREILEHSGLSFALMGDKMAVSPRDKAVKLLKAHPAEMQEIKAALMTEEAQERSGRAEREIPDGGRDAPRGKLFPRLQLPQSQRRQKSRRAHP